MGEPRVVPIYPDDLAKDRWCCLECVCQCVVESDVREHVSSQHFVERPMAGIDYVLAQQWHLLKQRRDAWIEERAVAFVAEMHEGFGADDFVAEAEIRSA